MIKHHHCCDQCGKSTDDPRKEKGWININEYCTTIHTGNVYENVFRYTNKIVSKGEELDFCSLHCLINWLLFNPATKNRKGIAKYVEKQLSDEMLKEIVDHFQQNN